MSDKTTAAKALGLSEDEILAAQERPEGLSVVTTGGEKWLIPNDGEPVCLVGPSSPDAADATAKPLDDAEKAIARPWRKSGHPSADEPAPEPVESELVAIPVEAPIEEPAPKPKPKRTRRTVPKK